MPGEDAGAVTLRPYRDADLPDLLDIAIAAWEPIRASFRAILGPDLFAVAFPDWRGEKRRQIASACRGEHGARVLVAELHGRPVGFASYYLDHHTGIGQIGNNAVHPGHQGSGIGTRMYKRVLADMRQAGMRCVKVTTGGDDSHAPARRAYQKVGFGCPIPSVTYFREL
jgi:ribosomal protein S18 acetylase RimI-like enzyme